MSAEPNRPLTVHAEPPSLAPNGQPSALPQFDDDPWDVFLPDGETEPLPAETDFWIESD